jgi:hypothetical protein
MEDIKPASNFELNVLKLGINRFQLKKGDRFTSNGSYFQYEPSTDENKGKGTRRRWAGRSDTISAVKYQKDVLRADNIKLIIDRPLSHKTEEEAKAEEELRKAEGWKASRYKVWEVQYAYEIPVDQIEQLVIMIIEKKWLSEKWEYRVVEHEVERETKELYFLKNHHPVSYHSKIEKKELDKVQVERGGSVYHVIGKLDDYHENEIALFTRAEENQRAKIETAKALVVSEELNLDNVLKLKADNGF